MSLLVLLIRRLAGSRGVGGGVRPLDRGEPAVIATVVGRSRVLEGEVGKVGIDASRPVGVGDRPGVVDPRIVRGAMCWSRKRSRRWANAVTSSADPVVRPAHCGERELAPPGVAVAASRAQQGGEVRSAIGREKNSDRIRWGRAGESSGSANVPFQCGRQVRAQVDLGRPPIGELAQQLPGRYFLEGGGAEQGRSDGCVGLGHQGQVRRDSSGTFGAQACQAVTTSATAPPDHCASIRVVIGSATVSNRSDVTTPNWPPPAPRRAQNRSGSWSASRSTTPAVREDDLRAEQAVAGQPVVAPEQAEPPPRVRPAIPTVGPHPAGRVRSWACSAAYTSARRAPAPIVALPWSVTEI